MQIVWTEEVNHAFEELEDGSELAMKEYLQVIKTRIDKLIDKVKRERLGGEERTSSSSKTLTKWLASKICISLGKKTEINQNASLKSSITIDSTHSNTLATTKDLGRAIGLPVI
jgi:hypothetical protein